MDNFLSAKKLGVTEAQRSALIAVLGMLERGEIEYIDADEMVMNAGIHYFNMSTWHIRAVDMEMDGCGTICCIGGLAERLGKVKLRGVRNKALDDLFYPAEEAGEMNRITVKPAAMALRNWLTTRKPSWDKVLA